jgi:hypothetical protein
MVQFGEKATWQREKNFGCCSDISTAKRLIQMHKTSNEMHDVTESMGAYA